MITAALQAVLMLWLSIQAAIVLVGPNVAFAAPPQCTSEWHRRRPPQDLIGSKLTMLCGADLYAANLAERDLSGVNLSGAYLLGANFRRAKLTEAHLVGAILDRADLSMANLVAARLNGASLKETILTEAVFGATDLSDTVMIDTEFSSLPDSQSIRLCGAYFEPRKSPPAQDLARTRALWSLRFERWPGGLAALRKDFKEAGLLDQERELTFAIQRSRALRAWYRRIDESSIDERLRQRESPCRPKHLADYFDHRPAVFTLSASRLGDKIESAFSFVAFNLTSAYGMYPGRPLRILVFLVPCFAMFYIFAIVHDDALAGIWRLWAPDRINHDDGQEGPLRVTAADWQGTRWTRWRGIIGTAVYFSLLSTFNIGWRDLNVGSWLTRIQRREYMLRASGWVRTISGIQALVSVYLVALWALTYFGRPFD